MILTTNEERDALTMVLSQKLDEAQMHHTISRARSIGFRQDIIVHPLAPPVGNNTDRKHISICVDLPHVSVGFFDLDYSSRSMCYRTIPYEENNRISTLAALADEVFNRFCSLVRTVSTLSTFGLDDGDYFTYIMVRLVRAEGGMFRELVHLCRDNSFPTREVLLAIAKSKGREEEILSVFKAADAAAELVK